MPNHANGYTVGYTKPILGRKGTSCDEFRKHEKKRRGQRSPRRQTEQPTNRSEHDLMKHKRLIAEARDFLSKSHVGTVTASELDRAVRLIREMAEAMEAAAPTGPRFANDEYLGKIRVEENSRTMLGRWSAEEIDPNHHFHIWSDMPCKGGVDCPAPKDEGGAR